LDLRDYQKELSIFDLLVPFYTKAWKIVGQASQELNAFEVGNLLCGASNFVISIYTRKAVAEQM